MYEIGKKQGHQGGGGQGRETQRYKQRTKTPKDELPNVKNTLEIS